MPYNNNGRNSEEKRVPIDIAPGTDDSVLTEYAYIQEMREAYRFFGEQGPDRNRLYFSQNFIERALKPGFLEKFNVRQDLCNYARNLFANGNSAELQNAVNMAVGIAYQARFGALPLSGYAPVPLMCSDGRPNSPALMKEFRKLRIERLKHKNEVENGYSKEGSPAPGFSKEFIDVLVKENGLETFVNDIGVPEGSRGFVAWARKDLSRLVPALYCMINGTQDAVSNQTIRPRIATSVTIKGEFKHRPTVMERFTDRFVRENAYRGRVAKASKPSRWPPFSNEFLHFINNPDFLKEIGFSDNVIRKFENTNIPQITPALRDTLCRMGAPIPGTTDANGNAILPRNDLPQIPEKIAIDISIALGREGREVESVKNALEKKTQTASNRNRPIDENATVKGVVKRLLNENNRSFSMKQQGKIDEMHYPDDLMSALFRPEVLPQARENAEAQLKITRKGYVGKDGTLRPSLGNLASNWVEIMPEDSFLFQIGISKQELCKAAALIAANENVSTHVLAQGSENPNAVWIASSFCILAQWGYTAGKGEDFWKRISGKQAETLRMTIGKNIVDMAKAYKKNHPDIFPPKTNNPRYGNAGHGGGRS